MAVSARYRILCQQLRKLRDRLLPNKFDPTGQYSDRKLTRAIAYRVLSHAEFESYLEDRVEAIALQALRKWESQRMPSQILMALIAFSGRKMESPPESVVPPQITQTKIWEERLLLEKRIETAAKSFFSSIKMNHGIKEGNLLGLLLPIGFPIEKIDPIWLAQMNSFGERRGQAAHKSCISHLPDPKGELDIVSTLLQGMKTIDQELNNLIS